ncbi:MAG: class I SAM-dependent methyltransferase [Acidobacteriia bacterium]|nr:class I SAM-dependent methyltransferase [Terriglobia bacterium]
MNPRPSDEEIHLFYPEEFYDSHLTAEGLLRAKDRQLALKFEYVRDLPAGRLLDIGCMKGEFMYFMQQRGWEVRGADFSTKPPNVFDLDIFYGDIESAGYSPGSFDLVTLWAVLEHVYYPKKMLASVYRLLRRGGKAVLLVTNFNSLPGRFMRHDDIPRHTTLFTRRTLGKMLQSTGFRPDRFDFNCDLFGGNNRGVLNYLVKLAAGEEIDEIVAQNRTSKRWQEFSSQVRGKPHQWMLKIDSLDIRFAPYLDRLMDRLRFGFIMIARATRI